MHNYERWKEIPCQVFTTHAVIYYMVQNLVYLHYTENVLYGGHVLNPHLMWCIMVEVVVSGEES